MCASAEKSSPEVIKIVETVTPSTPTLFNFDELGQHTGIHFVPHALTHKGWNKTRKGVVVDDDLGDDG